MRLEMPSVRFANLELSVDVRLRHTVRYKHHHTIPQRQNQAS